MNQTVRRVFNQLLLALVVSGVTPMAFAATAFQIMSDDEIALHTDMMAKLEGEARREYRDAQYQILRERAAEHGFTMPEDPPWSQRALTTPEAAPKSAATTGPAKDADASQGGAAQRHAAMREKMRSHREALLQAANAPPSLEEASNKTPAPTSSDAAPTAPTSKAPVAAATPELPASSQTPPVGSATPMNAASDPVTGPAAAPSPAATAALTPKQPTPAPTASSAPTETTAALSQPGPVEPIPAAVGRTQPPARPAPPIAPEPPTAPAGAASPATTHGTTNMDAYREGMRNRFDSYLKERQAQMEELARRQREQRETAMEHSRQGLPQSAPAQRPTPYPYPNMPAYGPRYPSAYPGYRTPYWQQR